MHSRLIFNAQFFSPEDIQLANLIPNIKDPELDTFESPITLTREDYTVKELHDYCTSLRHRADSRLEAFLSRIAKWSFQHGVSANAQLSSQHCRIYTLRKPKGWMYILFLVFVHFLMLGHRKVPSLTHGILVRLRRHWWRLPLALPLVTSRA